MPFGIKANIRAPHKFMRFGALCWLLQSKFDKIQVYGMSRGGRMVCAWVDPRDLGNYRAAFVAEENENLRFAPTLDGRAEAEKWAADLQKRCASGPVRPHAAAFGRKTATP